MTNSILKGTKESLGLGADYEVFDNQIINHINGVFSSLFQLGVGPVEGFFIEGNSEEWEDITNGDVGLNMIKSYVYLKVRMLFDPPSTSFHLEAMNKQIQELEWRISTHREWMKDPTDPREREWVVVEDY